MTDEQARLLIQKIQASKLMLEQIEQDLNDFLGNPKTEKIEDTYSVEDEWLGDDGKLYKKSTPYIKAKQWYCCGSPLTKEAIDGKTYYHCSHCNSKYSA